ncbi:MAG TPA: hypothetical protein VF658_14760 [Pyrinomonadaceae bacterium]|jgi:hypothetical protein
MAMKPLVRIIKGGHKAASLGEKERATQQQPQTADSSRSAIKATVSNWVKEFQQRSQVDAKRAFNNLFKEPLPRPSGM